LVGWLAASKRLKLTLKACQVSGEACDLTDPASEPAVLLLLTRR